MGETATDKQTSENGVQECTEPILIHSCEHCGVEFSPTREWQKFCSPKCRKDSWKKSVTLSALDDRTRRTEKKIESLEQRVKELEGR